MRSRARKPDRTCRRASTISSGCCASSCRRTARSACAGAVWTQERLVTLSSRKALAAARSKTSPTGAPGRSRCWCFEPCSALIHFPLRTPGPLSHRGASVNAMTPSAPRLSKSRFTSGLQCHKKLWWEVHEPDAKELQPDRVLQDLFDQGRLVGEAARARYPGGVLIDLPHHAYAERIAATKAALASGAPAVFEATFSADGITVAVDVLEKQGDGYRLTEVKASNSQKPEHIPDVAVQARVAAASGVSITAAEVMHLNKEFRA